MRSPNDKRSKPVRLAFITVVAAVLACNDGQRAVFSGLKPYRVPSVAMEPTIRQGEYAFARSYSDSESPRRGDLIVFRYPRDGSTILCKRVVGMPGETVEIRARRLHLNGRPVSEAYANHRDATVYQTSAMLPEPYRSRDNFGPLTLTADQYFVLGDNRDNSHDSRYWGAVPRHLIVSKIVSIGPRDGPLRNAE